MLKLELFRQLDDFFDSISQGLAVFDSAGEIIVYNRSAGRMFSLDPVKLSGRNIRDIFPEVWPELSRILETGKPQIGKQITVGDLDIIADRNPIYHDEEVIGVVSTFREVSEYERALTELDEYKRLNEQLDAIIDSSFDGLWVCNHEGRVIRVNRSSAEMDGVSSDHFIGRKMEDLVKNGFVDRSVTLEVLKKKTTVTFIQQTETGKQFLVTGKPVFDEQGEIKLVIVNERDYTFINQLRKELEASRALNREYRSELIHRQNQEAGRRNLVIRSEVMERVYERAMTVARVESTVLIQGESGVGKNIFANLIHSASERKQGPLIRVDCGAIPETLIESELFGYEKGAFTGAKNQGKPGHFELADAGTLFLDEVGELPMAVQVKLLRFLEEGELIRVGGIKSQAIDVRVIAATNRNLERMVQQKVFRKDLYYRLNVIPLTIPPLRDRFEDIPALVDHFLERFNKKYSTQRAISSQAVDCLCRYKYPGNIRELANLIEQITVLTPNDTIEMKDLPGNIKIVDERASERVSKDDWDLRRSLDSLEKELITRALNTFGTQVESANHLGIDQATLSRKIKLYNLKKIVKMHKT